MSDVPGGPYGQPIPPMQPPPGGGSFESARRKVQAPAIALIVTAVLGIFFDILSLTLQLAGISLGSMLGQDGPDPVTQYLGATVSLVLGFLGIIFAIVVLLGALKMKSLQSYGLAMVATILALFPCTSPCCLLGLPIGIWALVVLLDSNVKAAFRK